MKNEFRTKKFSGNTYYHDMDDSFTDLNDANIAARYIAKTKNILGAFIIMHTKIEKKDNGEYWIWRRYIES